MGRKLWEKEKLLVTSNFSFSNSVFKRLILQTRKNQGLFGKELTLYQTTKFWTSPSRKTVDNKINVTYKMNLVMGRLENSVGKGENAGHQHYLLFPHCFQRASVSVSLKVRIMWKELNPAFNIISVQL